MKVETKESTCIISTGEDDDDSFVPYRRPPPSDPNLSLLHREMKRMKEQLPENLTKVDKKEIHTVMEKWHSHEGWTEMEARLAADLAREMVQQGEVLNRRIFTSLINAFAKAPNLCHEAENILDFMEDLSKEHPELSPDRVAINTVIGAYAKSSEPKTAKEAERLLRRLEKDFRNGDVTRKPNARSYGKVIDAYAKERNPVRAREILRQLESSFRNGKTDVDPSVECYTAVIDAYARSNYKDAPDRAEEVMYGLLDFHDEYRTKASRPSAALFSAVINVWSKSSRREKTVRTDLILQLVEKYRVECSLYVYNSAMNVFASCSNLKSIRKTEDLLRFLEQHDTLMPDDYSYNAVLKAYTNKSMGKKAERLLQRWEHQYKSGKIEAMPDCHSYYFVIKCWATSNAKESAEKADNILKWMERNNVVPDVSCYNAALQACSQTGGPQAIQRAEAIWKKMGELDGTPQQDACSYHHLIQTYCCPGDKSSARKADQLLRSAVAKQAFKPNVRMCNTVISAIAQEGSMDSGVRAECLLNWMHSINLKPDLSCYKSAIIAHKLSENPDKGRKAMSLYYRMPFAPSPAIYTLLAEACRASDDLLTELFEECTSKGMLDKKLVHVFRQFGPPYVVQHLDRRDIPFEWRCSTHHGPSLGVCLHR